MYKLLIFSRIPVSQSGSGFKTLDLWARDLRAQVKVTGEIGLIAPLEPAPSGGIVPLPEGVRVRTYDEIRDDDALRRLVGEYDIVQIQGGVPAWEAGGDRRLARAARAEGRTLILSLSSNRAKAAILNAQKRGGLRRLKAAIRARSIRRTQRGLARAADGVMVVGQGLLDLMADCSDNIHVGIASWIGEDDIIGMPELRRKFAEVAAEPRLRLCVATRLERMKGIHLAVQALAHLRGRFGPRTPSLVIMGAGPERGNLEELATKLELSDLVEFAGTFDYPEPFFSRIREHDVMLLTNLSDEQPRLIFDAIAQGLIPVCPDTLPYRDLGVDDRLLFKAGDDEDLARTIAQLTDPDEFARVGLAVRELAMRHTIENMHRLRAEWMTRTLQGRKLAATPPG